MVCSRNKTLSVPSHPVDGTAGKERISEDEAKNGECFFFAHLGGDDRRESTDNVWAFEHLVVTFGLSTENLFFS